MRATAASILLLAFCATPALADRAPTSEERAKLEEALKAQGCTGGKIEFDDGKFEVANALCADGKKYELKFDQAFTLIKKELDDDHHDDD
jgi:hypothetical protein